MLMGGGQWPGRDGQSDTHRTGVEGRSFRPGLPHPESPGRGIRRASRGSCLTRQENDSNRNIE